MTVEKLTGIEIPYAAQIEFDGVIAMSTAVGGVDVCLAAPLKDKYVGLDLRAGTHTLEGWTALQFLRSRHGVGDGSDLNRISSQQVFLSALIRKIKSEEVLTNPLTLYSIAKAATQNMQLSTTLNHVDTMYSMALALKDIPLTSVVFVQYPSSYTPDFLSVTPRVGRRLDPDGCDRARRADRRPEGRRRRSRRRAGRRDASPVAEWLRLPVDPGDAETPVKSSRCHRPSPARPPASRPARPEAARQSPRARSSRCASPKSSASATPESPS